MRLTTAILLFILILTVSAFAADAPVVENTDGGWINWDRQMVKAVGHGVLPGDAEGPAQAALLARSAAISDAYRNLASVVNGVRVTGDTYVKNYVTQSDEVRLRI